MWVRSLNVNSLSSYNVHFYSTKGMSPPIAGVTLAFVETEKEEKIIGGT
ncbi:MAG: hypothetical protein K0R78_3272 [Pelosinus sp.]|jgi:hypothetical protein|nr:hypothetical protein [Pelosinus sp.]